MVGFNSTHHTSDAHTYKHKCIKRLVLFNLCVKYCYPDIRSLPSQAIEVNDYEDLSSEASPVFRVRNEIRQLIPNVGRFDE